MANYLNISKPAVSKWESGQSYPDITMLPILASFFDISVDELICYEPQMTKEQIKELYQKLANEVDENNFEEIYEKCESYSKIYYSCWEL